MTTWDSATAEQPFVRIIRVWMIVCRVAPTAFDYAWELSPIRLFGAVNKAVRNAYKDSASAC